MSALRLRTAVFACLLAGTAFAQQHTVQPSETLWSLAQRYGTTVDELKRLNNLSDDRLSLNQVLNLPATAVTAPADTPAAPAAQATAAAPASNQAAVAAVSYPDADTYTVQPGDSLYSIAQAYGFTLEEFMAINALRSDVINPGQILKTRGVSQDGRFVTIVQPGDSLDIIARRHGITPTQLAAANAINLHTVLNPGHRLVVPDASFVVAGEVESVPDIGGAAGPTITVQPGDSLWSISRRTGTSIEALMAENGLTSDNLRAGMSLRLVGGTGAAGAATATAAAAAPATTGTAEMVWPATGVITSRFGWRSLRIGGTNMHYGLDIDGNTGDPIYSATAGVVTFSGWRGGYGNLVIVEAANVEYYYAHASELLVSPGTIVAPGTLLARIGATGNVTGSHLHFEIRVDGSPVDPLPLLEAHAGSR